jgi:hypothetical protein
VRGRDKAVYQVLEVMKKPCGCGAFLLRDVRFSGLRRLGMGFGGAGSLTKESPYIDDTKVMV